MRICIFGAGAIGGYLAGFLGRAGIDVSVVARGPHLRAIVTDGLTVEMPDSTWTTHPRASDDPAVLGVQDAVLVTVKAPSLPSIAGSLAPLIGPRTSVAFITNGIPWWYFRGHGGPHDGKRIERLDPAGALWNAVSDEQTIGGIAWPASSVPKPGVVRMLGAGARGVTLGMPDGSTSPGLTALAEAIDKAGIQYTVTPRIRDAIWEKLAFNLSAGPMCVLTQAPVKATHEEPACIVASRHVMAEAIALIEAMGCRVALDPDKVVEINTKLGHRPSILQDLEAGRPMEIDALYTVPLELAQLAGVPMPTLELLAALIRVRARAAGLYAG